MDSLFSSASSFLKGSQPSSTHDQAVEGDEKGSNQSPQPAHAHSSNPSYGDAFASAQVLMGAAKAKMGSGASSGSQPDMGELADAAANVLGAASHYAHLEKTSYGSYVEKAETYLHQYGSKQQHHGAGSGEEGNPNNPGHHKTYRGEGEGAGEYNTPSGRTHEARPSRDDDNDDYGRDEKDDNRRSYN